MVELSVTTTGALLCLGTWSELGLVKDSDVKKVVELQDVEGKDIKLAKGWVGQNYYLASCAQYHDTRWVYPQTGIPRGTFSCICSLTRTRMMGMGLAPGWVRVRLVTPTGSPVQQPTDDSYLTRPTGSFQVASLGAVEDLLQAMS